MATPQQKRETELRYINDTRIPEPRRRSFAASMGFDHVMVPSMYAITTLTAVFSAALVIKGNDDVEKIQSSIYAVPKEILDLGERLHKDQASGEPTYQQVDLARAAKYVLSRDLDDIRNLTIIFPTHGNTVTLQTKPEPTAHTINGATLAEAYRDKLTETKGYYEEGRDMAALITGLFTLGIAASALGVRNLREKRIRIALDHYGIK